MPARHVHAQACAAAEGNVRYLAGPGRAAQMTTLVGDLVPVEYPIVVDGVQQPATLWVPDRRGSYAELVFDFCDSIGYVLDDEQRRDIDVLCSFGRGGRWVSLEQCIIEGRQNGKTKRVLLPIALADVFGVFTDVPDRIMWTSHLMSTSLDTFGVVKKLIEAHGSLSRRVMEVKESKSEQAIVLHNGTTFELHARSGGSGRGLGGRRVVLDEALFLKATALGALMPTMSARSSEVPGPVVAYGSSAGGNGLNGTPDSDALRALQRRGRAGGDPTLTLIEYKAPGGWNDPGCDLRKCTHVYGTPGCTLDREDYWAAGNHAMRRGRITVQFVRAERRALGGTTEHVLEFGRERLGWEQRGSEDELPIPIEHLNSTAIPDGYLPSDLGRPVFYIDISPGARSASIGVAADRLDGTGPHLDLTAHAIDPEAWLVDRVNALVKRWPNAIWGASTTGGIGAFLPALQVAGMRVWTAAKDRGQLARTIRLYTDAELAAACALLQRKMMPPAFGVTHADEPLVVTALQGAGTRRIGDGLFVWVRRGEQLVELSPLYAWTGALWLLETSRPTQYDLRKSVF